MQAPNLSATYVNLIHSKHKGKFDIISLSLDKVYLEALILKQQKKFKLNIFIKFLPIE